VFDAYSIIYLFHLFLRSIGLSEPPVEGLLSLCAISLVHSDQQLAELVIKELKKHDTDPTYGHHVAFMMAQYFIKYVRIYTFRY
jgi:hypothetical protein